MSLIKRWGLGVDLMFEARDAVVKMTRAHQATARLRAEFRNVGAAAADFAGKLTQTGMGLIPLALAFGAAVGKGSSLAADLEAQALTMRVLLGDGAKAAELMDTIRKRAAATPFQEGDLIEGSKRLLRLTRDNVGANLELLDTAMTMAALNPTKNITDATEAILDAAGGGGFERLKEFGVAFRAEDFAAAGKPGGEAWGKAVTEALTAEITRMTRGEDLVGALSNTFTGRLSTLQDSVTNSLRSFGQVINAEIGPMLAPLTDRIMALEPAVRQAATGLVASFRAAMARLQPVIDRVLGWWDALGVDGQARILQVVMSIGALSAVLVPIGGAIGAVVFAVVSLVGALAAAWPVISAVGSALLAAMIPVGIALAAVAAAALALFAGLRQEGEGPIDTVIRLAGAVQGFLALAFERATMAWKAFAGGFLSAWPGMGAGLERLTAAFRPLVDKVAELWALMLGQDATGVLTIWNMIGQAVALVGTFLLDKVVAGFELLATVLDVVVSIFRPFQVAIATAFQGLIGLITGSMDAGDAVAMLLRGMFGGIVAMVNAAFQLLAGAVEAVIRLLVVQLAGIPGMDSILGASGNLGADAIAGARAAFERETSNAIAGIDLAENRRAQAAKPGGTTINVAPQVENVVKVENTVKVDGRQLAKAQGAAAVRSGQRQGEAINPDARGRIIRGGVIRNLQPSEVL